MFLVGEAISTERVEASIKACRLTMAWESFLYVVGVLGDIPKETCVATSLLPFQDESSASTFNEMNVWKVKHTALTTRQQASAATYFLSRKERETDNRDRGNRAARCKSGFPLQFANSISLVNHGFDERTMRKAVMDA